MTRNPWSRDELLVAFNLYCKTPFGRLHQHNPDIMRLAEHMNRTPSAVAMKLVNFASLDPAHRQRNVNGLRNASEGDREIFAEFSADWERLAFESEAAMTRLVSAEPAFAASGNVEAEEIESITTVTEAERVVRVRLVQRFFRQAVLTSYGYRCAVCETTVADLLNASHIIPWSSNVSRRADPTNGIAMCVLHDRAFDRGIITVADDLTVLLARRAVVESPTELYDVGILRIAGKPLVLPDRFRPDAAALAYHRQNVFSDSH